MPDPLANGGEDRAPGGPAPLVTLRPQVAWAIALQAAQKAAKPITRDKYNEHASAKYASSGDYVGELRKVLHDAGLVAFELESRLVEGPSPKGTAVYLEVTYAVAHTETGYERSFVHRQALASQLGDKAVTAARTVGMRDFLRGLCLPHVIESDTPPPKGGQGRGRAQGNGRQAQPPRGQQRRPAGPPKGVALRGLPAALEAAEREAGRLPLFDGDAWVDSDWPSSRGEQLVILVGQWGGVDLMKSDDTMRAQACAHVVQNPGPLALFIQRTAVRVLAERLAGLRESADGLPDAEAVAGLSMEALQAARRAFEHEICGRLYGWRPGPCNACGGDSKRRADCRACKGAGSLQYPNRPGAAA